jgi:nucleotide-binding universal stress UspA family protein
MPISTMLVPVGADPNERLILRYVCGLSVQSVRRALVVTVVDDSGMEGPVIAAEVDRARERLADWTCSVENGCSMQMETRVVTGDPKEAILALAQQSDIDVICCGTHGKSIMEAILEGSISEGLFSSGKIRTMTVRNELLESVPDPSVMAREFAKRLVVPTDFSASATRAWLSAVERPVEAIGTLTAIHVMPSNASDDDRSSADIILRGLCDIAAEHGIAAKYEILTGSDPVQTVLDYLKTTEATGVITGQRGRGALRRAILGSLSLRLLREAPCPVVVQP